jgi:hypothetical protein
MIRRGNIWSTRRASVQNFEQGRNPNLAESLGQTFSVNRLADTPCCQSSFSVDDLLDLEINISLKICRPLCLYGPILNSPKETDTGSAGTQPVKGDFGVGGKIRQHHSFDCGAFFRIFLSHLCLKKSWPKATCDCCVHVSNSGSCPTLQMNPASSRANATIALLRGFPLLVKCVSRLHSRCCAAHEICITSCDTPFCRFRSA